MLKPLLEPWFKAGICIASLTYSNPIPVRLGACEILEDLSHLPGFPRFLHLNWLTHHIDPHDHGFPRRRSRVSGSCGGFQGLAMDFTSRRRNPPLR